MSRSMHPGLVLGVLAALSFAAGVALEPLFERPASADIQVPAGKPKAAQTAPASGPAAAKEAAMTPPQPGPQITDEPQPNTEHGIDPEHQVEFFEMKNMPGEDGQGETARDVDMIDEPGLPAPDNQPPADAVEEPKPSDDTQN